MKFVQAKHFRQGGNLPITRIVIHDMEFPEKITAAEDVAAYFQRERFDKNDKPIKTSAHYCCDSDSIVQCVRDEDSAYHAPPNQHSIGIELAGYARQNNDEWLDSYGIGMLRDQAAPLVRGLAYKYDVPLYWLSVEQVRAGHRGITSHNNVSLAFGQSTHTDPGPSFPIHEFMGWVVGPPPVPQPQPEEDMAFIYVDKSGQDGGQVYDSGSVLVKIPTGEDAAALRDAGVKEVKLSHAMWSTLNDAAEG